MFVCVSCAIRFFRMALPTILQWSALLWKSARVFCSIIILFFKVHLSFSLLCLLLLVVLLLDFCFQLCFAAFGWCMFCWVRLRSCCCRIWNFPSNQAVFCSFSWSSKLDTQEHGIFVCLLFLYFWSSLFVCSEAFWLQLFHLLACSLIKYIGRQLKM